MKRGLLGLILGLFIGIAATLAMPAAAAVKQYILTQVDYPIVVKGVEFNDPEQPILNYEGSTYVPLAKLGDITGVQYKWNDTLKRVEIGPESSGPPTRLDTTPPAAPAEKKPDCNIAGQKGATLCPDTVIERPKEPGYKGYPDTKDPSYQMAIAMARDKQDYPPLLSEGWVSSAMLEEIQYVTVTLNKEKNELYFSKYSTSGIKYLLDLKVTAEFISAEKGDFLIDGIKIKKYYGNIFFNINDLIKSGIM